MAGRGRYRGIYMRRLVLKTYDCVVFVSSVIFFFFFLLLCRACLSFISWGQGWGAGRGLVLFGCGGVQGERVWKSPPCECESDRWTGVAEDTRRIWRSGEWVAPPPSLSCTRIRKDLVQRLKKTKDQKEGLKLKGERYGPVTLTQ